MSRAFVKEDIDPPERRSRKRSHSGLPPGAINYLSARGAARLEAELARLTSAGGNSDRVAQIEGILRSAEIVEEPPPGSRQVYLGATVTAQAADGKTDTYTVVGVDELELEPQGVTWVSPLGKALLAAQLGERIITEEGRALTIIGIS